MELTKITEPVKSKRATPNSIFAFLLSKKAQIERVTFTKREDGTYAVTVVAGQLSEKQFAYSILTEGRTLSEACEEMLDNLKNKEWS